MDTSRLSYFLSVSRTGSLREAAELHRVSPAAMSKAMRLLQEETARTLFIAEGRGIRLTDEGRKFARELEPMLGALQKLVATQDTSVIARRVFRLASFEVFSTAFLEQFAAKLDPQTELEVHELGPGRMEDAIVNGTADAGLTYLPIPRAGLDFMKLKPVAMGIYGSRSRFRKVEPDTTPFAVPLSPIEGSPNRVRGTDGWPEHEFPRHVRYRVGLLETALGLCRQGLAVAYIPRFIARLHNERVKPSFRLDELELPSGFKHEPVHAYLVKRRQDVETREMKLLTAVLRQELTRD